MNQHFSARPHLTVHTRSKNHSAVAGCAYRLGLKLYDERTETWHDYRKRALSRAVVHALTVAPSDAPPWATDPAALWNAAESAERRRDGQVARDYRVPVPLGFTDEQGIDLAEALARFIADEFGTAVSFALHRDAKHDAFGKAKPEGMRGLHAHLYFPTRPIKTGSIEGAPAFGRKIAEFRDQESGAAAIELLNSKWAELSNLIASSSGLSVRVDHRSYRRMGLSRTAEPALGQAATALERSGQATRLGDALRAHRAARDGTGPTDQAVTEGGVEPMPFNASPVNARAAAPIGTSLTRGQVHTTPASAAPARPTGAPTTPPVAPAKAPPVTHRPPRLTRAMIAESPAAWEVPRAAPSLADRFGEAYASRTKAAGVPMDTAVLVIVQAVGRALAGLMFVMRALLHLDADYKRFAMAKHDNEWAADQQRGALAELRQEHAAARKPYTPRMSAAHRARLAKIRTLEEEVADKYRLSQSIDEQLHDISRRSQPWRLRGLNERRLLKLSLAELHAQDAQASNDLVGVAAEDELPWLKLLGATSEPTLSLQKLADAAEAGERKSSQGAQHAFRPPKR